MPRLDMLCDDNPGLFDGVDEDFLIGHLKASLALCIAGCSRFRRTAGRGKGFVAVWRRCPPG
jgi:hypothetical protein